MTSLVEVNKHFEWVSTDYFVVIKSWYSAEHLTQFKAASQEPLHCQMSKHL